MKNKIKMVNFKNHNNLPEMSSISELVKSLNVKFKDLVEIPFHGLGVKK